MKVIYSIFVLAITTSFAFANEIENLKTNKEVNTFLTEYVLKKDSGTLMLDESKTNSEQYGKNKFYKLDLDNNGLTDLVVDGKYLIAVIDNGSKNYSFHSIDRGGFSLNKYTLINIVNKDEKPILVVRKYIVKDAFDYEEDINYEGKIGGKDTEKNLVFKFGGFIEYNPKPNNLKIEEINFSNSLCFGSCPVFKLQINQDKSAFYDAIQYNDKKGIFKATLDSESFNRIIETLKYIQISGINNKYSVPWTDDQTAFLAIKYNNGKVKKISDYGMIGTFGLENLYNQLFELRKSQNWEK